jgi:hypothetical protein
MLEGDRKKEHRQRTYNIFFNVFALCPQNFTCRQRTQTLTCQKISPFLLHSGTRIILYLANLYHNCGTVKKLEDVSTLYSFPASATARSAGKPCVWQSNTPLENLLDINDTFCFYFYIYDYLSSCTCALASITYTRQVHNLLSNLINK